jgi:hypothetical protein
MKGYRASKEKQHERKNARQEEWNSTRNHLDGNSHGFIGGSRRGTPASCAKDKAKLCGHVKPGEGRTHACLYGNLTHLSPLCQQRIAAVHATAAASAATTAPFSPVAVHADEGGGGGVGGGGGGEGGAMAAAHVVAAGGGRGGSDLSLPAGSYRNSCKGCKLVQHPLTLDPGIPKQKKTNKKKGEDEMKMASDTATKNETRTGSVSSTSTTDSTHTSRRNGTIGSMSGGVAAGAAGGGGVLVCHQCLSANGNAALSRLSMRRCAVHSGATVVNNDGRLTCNTQQHV